MTHHENHGAGSHPCARAGHRNWTGAARWSLALAAIAGAALHVDAAPAPDELAADAVEVGLRKQLLVDDHVIARRSGLTRFLNQARKENDGRPVVSPDRPWEDKWHFGYYLTAYHVDGKFRLWYDAWAAAVGYAESADGLHWEKPALGVYNFSPERARAENFRGDPSEYSGTDNNIVLGNAGGFSIYLDLHETDSAHRFKAAFASPEIVKACLAHSARHTLAGL